MMATETIRGLIVACASALVLSACGSGFVLDLSRSQLAFEDTPVGGADDEGLDVVILRGGPAELTATLDPPSAPFAVVQTPDPVLGTDEPTFVSVRFQPTTPGPHLAVLSLTLSNVLGTTTHDIALSGEGLLAALDIDRDGFVGDEDCDEEDASTFPGAPEICDGVDNDCDGLLPTNESDFDGDGVAACAGDCSDDDDTVYPEAPELCDGKDNDCDGDLSAEDDGDGDGVPPCAGDCDDDDPFQFPGATELCNAADDDCDGEVPASELDSDNDGWHVCAGDCADDDPLRYPLAPEACNELDDDCDAIVPGDEVDDDGDGFLACAECDDTNPDIVPGGTELCDGVDTDCDGTLPADEVDADGDTFLACAECDDASDVSYPGADELCDGLDNDCDGVVPDLEVDDDGDSVFACLDCDDTDATAFPGNPEVCDGVDNDCDGVVPVDEVDVDIDGFPLCDDCDDDNDLTFPGATEECDGEDNDCDTVVPDDEIDDDGDGEVECGLDCDDEDPDIYGGADEECFDGVDNDCDGTVNQGCDCPVWGHDVSGSGCTTFGTFECPWPGAQLAIDEAIDSATCDEAWLKPATYAETLVIDGDVLVRGPGDRGAVVIDANGADSAISIPGGGEVTLLHMSIEGGAALEGGGLFASDSYLVIGNVLFEGNSCSAGGAGGAIFVEDSEVAFAQLEFQGNSCGFGGVDDGNDGGAIFFAETFGSVTSSWFEGNSAGDGSAIFIDGGEDTLSVVNSTFLLNQTDDSDDPVGEIEGGAVVVDANHKTILNNVFADNTGSAGGGAIVVTGAQGTATLVAGNVVVYNDSPAGAGIHFGVVSAFGSTGTYVNNIVAFNQGYGAWSDGSAFPADFQYNDVFGNTSGAYGAASGPLVLPINNIASDPAFVSLTNDGDWTNDDLALQVGSACIDTGDPRVGFNDPDGTRADMGIYGGPAGDWVWPP
ncbi:MAG: hypothetical protein GY898_09135 [Proteobacteria bacterium]|nr:hypothetical protein [Pseudomonadota bacterium]